MEKISQEFAKDLIELVNSLKGLPKSSKVDYMVQNKKTQEWVKKSFMYTPLDIILDKIKENNNFALIQPIGVYEDGTMGVKNILIHKTGEILESKIYPINGKEKIQDEGAEITYKKRYSLGAFLGISTEEDTDGSDPEATQTEEVKASQKQVDILLRNYQGENLEKLLKSNNIEKIEDISKKKASELIAVIMEKKGA